MFQVYLVTGDVTVKEDVERIVTSVVSHYGKLDILVSGLRNKFMMPGVCLCLMSESND
jgi:NAD(P)-dependent dehydrogenase (short-subunit alcohol dehydrogenase family)